MDARHLRRPQKLTPPRTLAARDHETACSIVNRSCIHNSTYATTSLPNHRHQTSTPSIQTAQTRLSTYICTNNS